MLREASSFDWADPVGLYFGTQGGSVWVSPNEGDEWLEAASDLPPILSVEAPLGGVTVLLPSILAAEAGGQGRFELEAEKVGDALRALPVANMLFDERGELRRLVNVYVDGVDIRGGDGVDSPLAGGEELRVVQAVAGG